MTEKIILLADLHIVPDDNLHGNHPLTRLHAAVDDILSHHADAAAIIILGDIADKGDIASYRLAADALSRLPAPFYLLPGNHDNYDNMRRIFPGLPNVIQKTVATPAGDFVLTNSVQKGEVSGEFCFQRGEWLKKVLRRARRPVFICMHHPPLSLPFLQDDEFAPENFQYLVDAMDAVPGMVRYFLFGHLHAAVDGVWRGVPFSVLRSISHQTFLTTEAPAGKKYIYTQAAPHYGILLADEEQIILHHHGFLENRPVADD